MLLWQHFGEKFFGDFLFLFEFESLLFDQVLQVVRILLDHLEHQVNNVHFPFKKSQLKIRSRSDKLQVDLLIAVERFEHRIQLVKVGPHFGLLTPTISHYIHIFGGCSRLGH